MRLLKLWLLITQDIFVFISTFFFLASPAVDHYGVVASPPLSPGHLFYHTSDTAEVRAAAIRTPIGHVKLYSLVGLAQLYIYIYIYIYGRPNNTELIIMVWPPSYGVCLMYG